MMVIVTATRNTIRAAVSGDAASTDTGCSHAGQNEGEVVRERERTSSSTTHTDAFKSYFRKGRGHNRRRFVVEMYFTLPVDEL